MRHADAYAIANRMVAILKPTCTRIEIAGSLRRNKPDVKDIEIVCVPNGALRPPVQFGAKATFPNLMEQTLAEYAKSAHWRFLKNGPRYKQLESVHHGIKLDLFIVKQPAQWGVIYTIRTGPADFSHWIVTSRNAGGALPNDSYVKDGCVWTVPFDGTQDRPEPMSEETDFFDFLGLEYIEPAQRAPRWTLFPRT